MCFWHTYKSGPPPGLATDWGAAGPPKSIRVQSESESDPKQKRPPPPERFSVPDATALEAARVINKYAAEAVADNCVNSLGPEGRVRPPASSDMFSLHAIFSTRFMWLSLMID